MTVEQKTMSVEETTAKVRELDFHFAYRSGEVTFFRDWSDREVETFLPSEEEGMASLLKRKCELKGVRLAYGACRIRLVDLDALCLPEQEKQEEQPDSSHQN
jgi:hypothetical protein